MSKTLPPSGTGRGREEVSRDGSIVSWYEGYYFQGRKVCILIYNYKSMAKGLRSMRLTVL